jgi:hypothetical protein
MCAAWKQSQVTRNQIREIGWVLRFNIRFLAQKVPDRERLVSWRIVGIPNRWAKVQSSFCPQLYETATVFPHNTSLLHCLDFWNEFKVNSTLDVEESDDNGHICDLDMRTLFESFTSLRNTWLFHTFSLISLSEHCTRVTFSLNLTQNLTLIGCCKYQ